MNVTVDARLPFEIRMSVECLFALQASRQNEEGETAVHGSTIVRRNETWKKEKCHLADAAAGDNERKDKDSFVKFSQTTTLRVEQNIPLA